MNIDWNNIIVDIWTTNDKVIDEFSDEEDLNVSGETTLNQIEVLDTLDDINYDEFSLDAILDSIETENFMENDDFEEYLENASIDIEHDQLMESESNREDPSRSQNRKKKPVKRLDKYSCSVCNQKFASSAYQMRHYTTLKHKRAARAPSGETKSKKRDRKKKENNGAREEEKLSNIKNFYESFNCVEENENVASNSNVWRCELCDKNFARQCYLKQHNLTYHSGEKPFRCRKCGKKYADEFSLDVHQMRHVNVTKAHQCLHCPKSYINKIDLKRHEMKHFESMPHVCDICPKKFARKDHLEKHKTVHFKRKQWNMIPLFDLPALM